jgi:integrase
MTAKRRRKPGEGSVKRYNTARGPRWYVVYGIVDTTTGKRRQKLERGFLSEKAANGALRERLVDVAKGHYVEPSKQRLGEYLTDEWLASLRNAESTQASYRRNLTQHVVPRLGGTPLSSLTGMHLTALYRELEAGGRRDGKPGGLSSRTVRYIHTILHRALSDAVQDGRLLVNPADRAKPPTAKQSVSPEMKTWDRDELRAFLAWAATDDLYIAWLLLAMTGVRRGELLALRWGDLNLDGGTIAVRRSLGVVKAPGEQRVVEGPTKSGKARVVDIDPETVAALRAYRSERAGIGLQLVRDDAYVVSHPDGARRHPERFSREFARRLLRCRTELETGQPAMIRLHDLRHTHATLMLQAGVHPKIVSERLGHAKVSITMDVYSHAVPSMQREAAGAMAALVYGSRS